MTHENRAGRVPNLNPRWKRPLKIGKNRRVRPYHSGSVEVARGLKDFRMHEMDTGEATPCTDAHFVLTASEAAEILQLERFKVYFLIKDGTLQAFKIGTTWRVTHESVQNFLNPSNSISPFVP